MHRRSKPLSSEDRGVVFSKHKRQLARLWFRKHYVLSIIQKRSKHDWCRDIDGVDASPLNRHQSVP